MADLVFDWFGFAQTCKSLSNSTQTKKLNPNQSNRRSAVQWYFPLRSKWVFSGYTHNSTLLNCEVQFISYNLGTMRSIFVITTKQLFLTTKYFKVVAYGPFCVFTVDCVNTKIEKFPSVCRSTAIHCGIHTLLRRVWMSLKMSLLIR